MTPTTIELPFVRSLRIMPPGSRAIRSHHVVERLALTVSSPDATAEPLVEELFEDGAVAQVRVRIGARSYQPFGPYRNATAEEQADRSEADLRRTYGAYGDVSPEGTIVRDGKAEQEETRAALQRDLALVGGVLYQPAPLPNIELAIETGGRVSVGYDQPLQNPDVRPWMRFSLDRTQEADNLASYLILRLHEYGKSLDWRGTYPYGIVRNHFARWRVNSAYGIEGVAYASGGTGKAEERAKAFAMAYVALMRPWIGHYSTDAVRLFAEIRDGIGRNSDLRWLLRDLSLALSDKDFPTTMEPAKAREVALQSFALHARLTRSEEVD